MKLTRISKLTGNAHTREVNCTPEQYYAWIQGTLIQIACPDANADDREFIMTGITPEEWDAVFANAEPQQTERES